VFAAGGVLAGGCSVATNELSGSGGIGGSGAGGAGNTGGGGNPGTTDVGAPCTSNEACGSHPESVCILPDTNVAVFTSFWGAGTQGGGVAGGYCTRSCEESDECPAGSRCSGNICLLQCDYGSPALPSLDAPLDNAKCMGRDDLMCVPTSGDDALCMPNCGSDEACGDRLCDARTGVCTAPKRSGEPNGEPCTPDDEATPEDEDPCAGTCLPLFDDEQEPVGGVCSGPCTLGGDASHECGGVEAGLCAIQSSFDAALGDVGYCAESCTFHGMCDVDGGLFCFDLGHWSDSSQAYCLSARACPIGTECDDGEVCTQAGMRSVCLDGDGAGGLLIPLDGEAGSGGVGGGGGGGGG
jgi:hypothetical protein